MQSRRTGQRQGHVMRDGDTRWRLYVSVRCTCIPYRTGACIYFFSLCLLALCLTDLTSLMVRKAKDLSVKHACAQPGSSQTHACLFLLQTETFQSIHSLMLLVSHLWVRRQFGKPTSSLFTQEEILWCFKSTMNFYGPRWKEDVASEDICHPEWIFLFYFLLFFFIPNLQFCTVTCFGFSLIIPLDNIICFRKMMTDKSRLLLQNIFKLLWTVKKKKKKRTGDDSLIFLKPLSYIHVYLFFFLLFLQRLDVYPMTKCIISHLFSVFFYFSSHPQELCLLSKKNE